MKFILISGERGTGKTTISKNVAKGLGYNYYTDYDIINRVGIKHGEKKVNNARDISIGLYRKFFSEHKNENIVVDAETSILPSQVKVLQKEFDIDAVFLGFYGISETSLFEQLKSKHKDMQDDEIKNWACGLLELGVKVKFLCEEENIKFQPINYNRVSVIEELSQELIIKYKY